MMSDPADPAAQRAMQAADADLRSSVGTVPARAAQARTQPDARESR